VAFLEPAYNLDLLCIQPSSCTSRHFSSPGDWTEQKDQTIAGAHDEVIIDQFENFGMEFPKNDLTIHFPTGILKKIGKKVKPLRCLEKNRKVASLFSLLSKSKLYFSRPKIGWTSEQNKETQAICSSILLQASLHVSVFKYGRVVIYNLPHVKVKF